MTIAGTLNRIRATPCVVGRHKDGEWRVSICLLSILRRYQHFKYREAQAKQEAMAHYTNDADDALSTAQDMSRRWTQS